MVPKLYINYSKACIEMFGVFLVSFCCLLFDALRAENMLSNKMEALRICILGAEKQSELLYKIVK